MNPLEDNRDEEQIEAILSAAARDFAPPDAAFLARLREQSAEVFRSSSQPIPSSLRGRLMSARTLRLVAACAAALLVAGPSVFWWLFVRDAEPSLARVLDDAAGARSLHGRLLRDGHVSEIWTEAPGRLRRDDPDGTYQIAADGRLWRIDEKANRAASAKSPYHRDTAPDRLDLLALLGLPAEPGATRLAESRPVGETDEEGVQYLVYHVEVPAQDGPIDLEARVERRTHRLHRLQARERRNGAAPLAELSVLAYNEAVPEEKFVVRDTLTEDGRVGKVHDVQGVAGIKPVMHQRWTPLFAHLLLKPGDWLRTDIRGANAADLRLVKRTRVILGPGTIVELHKPDQIRLHEGEIEITVAADAKLELVGPGDKKIAIKGTKRYRVDKDLLVSVRDEPRWLKAFKGKTSDESIGSLIAKVDGRNVPLTVGIHKVTVDVRDQIARTEIEESFVNRTDHLMEGVFHFPLPPGASVSGFGMWIGDKLVEADIVEKQRAREIYETILQEKRDPGLLEWTGGNIFKARVYPIFAHSEKRIKISYTQVLPLKGGQYRYSYGLQSDLLQLHPLRELNIDVKINSASALKNVTCPTHPTRLDRTAHSAHVEFTAQEYSPTRDFEVVIEPDGKQSEAVLIPHRRGDDGYFMLQLSPPATAGEDERDILPDGAPVRLVLLADTSASMDARQRGVQAQFLSALMSCLTPKDTINLAAFDVECDWVFEKPVAATPSNLVTIRQFLARRTSLGWTDLDKAFASALKQCEPNTHVVYVGDGIITTGDADPVAFTKRLRRLYDEAGKVGTFHAVSPGTSYESSVLKAIASLGSGSVRHAGGEQPAPATALELLGEITRPTLRDLKVEFRGLRTARVYPEELPNLPPGSQQIVLGRYLPEGRDQAGEVVVTGTRNGKPVSFRAAVPLKDAEQGNSFIPRLWARMHLDHLLEQGGSPSIHDEIIALSEEYQIITPYTSLLVLESDADRERFKVKRTFRMRDGEKFFAQGRDNADYELKQQQMKRAAAWRRGLQRRVLRQLATLGRDVRWLQMGMEIMSSVSEVSAARSSSGVYFERGGFLGGVGGGGPGEAPSSDLGLDLLGDESGVKLGAVDRKAGTLPAANEPEAADQAPREKDEKETELAPDDKPLEAKKELRDREEGEVRQQLRDALPDDQFGFLAMDLPVGGRKPRSRGEFGREFRGGDLGGSREWYRRQALWLTTLFPDLPSAAHEAKRPPSTWPEEARTLARSLLRTEKLAKVPGGIEIVQQSDSFDVRWGDLASRSRVTALWSTATWLTRAEGDRQPTILNWCDGRERGVLSRSFQLGRVRSSKLSDLRLSSIDLADHSLSSLEDTYGRYAVTIERPEDGRAVLLLKESDRPGTQTRIVLDTNRHVLLEIEHQQSGKRTALTRFEDFVEVGGSWWARKIETTDAEGRMSQRLTRTIRTRTADKMAKQVRDELAGRDKVQFLRLPLKGVKEAKQAVAAGKASFDDHFALLRFYAGRQQWTRAIEQLGKCEGSAAGQPGVRWLRSAVLLTARKHEELRKRLLDEAARLAGAKPADGEPTDSDELTLAEHVINQARQVLAANEMLTLLDQLRPIYDRQPARRASKKSWAQQRLNALQQTGRTDEVLRVQKQLAVEWPRDYSLQQQYAQALANAGDHPAAYAWLKGVLDGKARWLPQEADSLRSTYAQLLEAQGRYAELADYLADWIKKDPESSAPYMQYLSALIRTGQMEKANELTAKWLREGQAPGTLSPAASARVQAAISLALGQGHNLYSNRIEPRWLKPLADAALTFARHDDRYYFAQMILTHWQFQQSDEKPRIRKALLADLRANLDTMPPERIEHYLSWVWPGPAEEWQPLGDGLHKRWSAEADADKKHALGGLVKQVLHWRDDPAVVLAFLHEQWKKGPANHRADYSGQLFRALLSQPWSAEYEDEALALLGKLADNQEEAARLRAQVAALYQLTDQLIEARRTAKMKAVEHPEKLTRIELRKKQDEALRLARAGLAERLKAAAAKERGSLAPWLTIERLYLLVRLDQELPEVAAGCWKILGDEPPQAAEGEAEDAAVRPLDDILRERCLATLMNLAARKGADPALTTQLEKYIDRGIAREGDGAHWKQLKQELLIAQDRPKELEKALRQWAGAGDTDNHWRVSLAFLLAEQGRIPEAIKLLEAVESEDELSPAAYRTLSDWYLAANRREQYERTRRTSYKAMDEWRIHQTLAARLRPWQRNNGHATAPVVDADVLSMFAVLLDKSSNPQQHLGLLQQFYQATHDFRLLAGLADAVVGHTAETAYPFLGGLQSLLAEVGDEATVDELAAYVPKVRQRVQTPVDRRALDLLECLIERRAAELKNQPGPHAEAALTALKRAFKGEWSSGEGRLMADFLAGLGAVPQAPLAKEQLRQLEALHNRETKGTIDRLHVAHRYAQTLHAHLRIEDALSVLQAALEEHQQAHNGVLPATANYALETLVGFLEHPHHYDRGEKILLAQLRHPAHEQQRYWLTRRLYQLYNNALSSDGEVSFGTGQKLYQAAEGKLRGELATPDPEHRRQLIEQLCNLYQIAHNKKIDSVRADLRAFAFNQLPDLLKRQTSNYQNVVSNVSNTIHALIGPRGGVEFLIVQIGREPAWLRFSGQDLWSQFGWQLAHWKEEAKDIGDLEKPLLKLVLVELRRDLETRQARNRVLYHRHYGHFWAAKDAVFVAVAEEVLRKHPRSGPAARYIADYFYDGLNHTGRAIEILLAAHKAKLLDDDSQSRLVDYLQWQNRHAEAIPLLQALIQRRPTMIHDRARLLMAYFRTNRPKDHLALLKETDAFFHAKDLWREDVIFTLADSCVETQLYTQSVAYFNELIPLHQRTHPRRGIGDGALSNYYGRLAQAYAGLGKTADAVDAAAGAIVSWGPSHRNREQALEALRQVLRNAPNLDAYVTARDLQVAANGLDSAVIRKELGRIYLQKGDPAKAVPQLQSAITLQPNDLEAHRLLINCFDKQGDKPKVILALLDAAQASRRDLQLYRDLGNRLREQPKEAERAYTSVVEVMPHESEGHALLAEVRQQQNRWTEAATQWEQVARIRALEPTGLLKLAAARVHLRQWNRAEEALRQVASRSWPPRFGDVRNQVRQLEDQIRTGRP